MALQNTRDFVVKKKEEEKTIMELTIFAFNCSVESIMKNSSRVSSSSHSYTVGNAAEDYTDYNRTKSHKAAEKIIFIKKQIAGYTYIHIYITYKNCDCVLICSQK